MTQLEMTTSTVVVGSGISSMWPLRNCDVLGAGGRLVLLGQGQHLVGHVQAVGEAGRADAAAESRTSMPPPLPRSSTVSPGLSSASAVGLPQPSEACTASCGNDGDLVTRVEICR